MSTIVIMPGGFHPFHAGHMALYNSARKAFPDADLYVAATNSQETRPFPFAVKEKLAKVAGVAPGHFVQVKSPFQAKEITQNYDPDQDVLIFVRSEKDRNESPKPGGMKKDGTPAYFQPYTGKDMQPFAKHAYFAYLPTVEFGPGITSATEIRKAWPTLNDKRKTAMVMSLYPAAQQNQKLAANIVGMLDQVMGNELSEARSNPEQNVKAESGMKELEAIANTISDPENWAVSMTSEPKLGINPQVGISEDTPKGIYFYPLNYVLGKIHSRKPLPWANDYPYIQLFQYDRSGEMTQQTQVDPAKLKQALSQYCSPEIMQQAEEEDSYDGTPFWYIYDCLSRLGKGDETNIIRWNKVLRDLGFTSVFDPGRGWIAENEPTQGVVLDPRIIKQHKTITNRKESKVITPAKIEQLLFDEIDMELARNRIWQMYDPDGSKLRQAVKKYAMDPKFKPYMGKSGSQELEDTIKGYRLYGARQLSDVAMGWYKAQQPVNEGPYVSRIMRPSKVSIYLRIGKGAKLVATDIPYEILDKYIDKVINKYPQFKPTDFSFKASDNVDEGFGLPMPGTYEQEHDMDQKQSGHHTHDLTSESKLSESADYLDEK